MVQKLSLKIILFLLLAWIFLPQDLMAQCAMCRASVENNVSNGDIGIAAGLNTGILYLFVAPYLVIGTVAFFWYRNSKKNRARKNSISSSIGR